MKIGDRVKATFPNEQKPFIIGVVERIDANLIMLRVDNWELWMDLQQTPTFPGRMTFRKVDVIAILDSTLGWI